MPLKQKQKYTNYFSIGVTKFDGTPMNINLVPGQTVKMEGCEDGGTYISFADKMAFIKEDKEIIEKVILRETRGQVLVK